jgi:hypothetical protein
MKRYSTGVWTVGDCLRIELSFLLKKGYLLRGKVTLGSLSWNRGDEPSGDISIVCNWPQDGINRPIIILRYTTTNTRTKEKEHRNDTIYL